MTEYDGELLSIFRLSPQTKFSNNSSSTCAYLKISPIELGDT